MVSLMKWGAQTKMLQEISMLSMYSAVRRRLGIVAPVLLVLALCVSACQFGPDLNDPEARRLHEQRLLLQKAEQLFRNQDYDGTLTCLEPIRYGSLFDDRVFELWQKAEVEKFRKMNQRRQDDTIYSALKDVDERLTYPDTYGQTVTITGEKIVHESADTPMDEVLKKRVSMDLRNAGLADIIMALGSQAGLNIIADSALDQSAELTVKVDNVPLYELLSYVARNLQLDFHLGENMIWVTAGAANAAGAPKLETRIFKLKTGAIPSSSADIRPELDDALEAFLDTGPQGAAFRLYRDRNLLVVKNTRDNMRIIEQLIKELDEPIQQVLIEARYYTISQNDLKELGFNLSQLERTNNKQTGIGTFTNDLLRNFPTTGNATLAGIIGSMQYEVVIHALNEMRSAQAISSPRVTVLNNQTAMIRRGDTLRYFEEYELETVVDEAGVARSQPVPVGAVQEIQLGINFEVKAMIGHDGRKIMLELKPNIVEFVDWETFITARLPRTRENEMTTTVVVDSGQTVIMGGIITETKTHSDNQIPILGRIPLFGALFGEDSRQRSPDHLIIFVTATIIDGSGRSVVVED